jgi:cysteine-rich repeat protein
MLRLSARPHVLALAAALLLSACGGTSVFEMGNEDGGNPPDAGTGNDAGTSNDAGAPDAGVDAGVDAGTDAGTADAGHDAGTDAGSDAGADAGTDAGSDAGADAGHDAGTDAGSDAGADAGHDAGSDAGADAGHDAGTDAGVDAGSDAGAHDGGTTTASCGNGILEGNEECDDGNNLNFDGCNASCHVEQSQRFTSMQMQFSTDGVCAANALGGAIVLSYAQTQLQTGLTNGVNSGSISILLTLVGATDSPGTNQSGLVVGVLGGAPEQPAGSPSYNGSSDLDWWYLPDSASVNASGEPTAKLAANASGGVLSAGPGSFTLPLTIGAGVTQLGMSAATLHALIGSNSAPTESTTGLPPGYLPSQHLSPNFRSVETTGSTDVSQAGTLCGNVSAASLATALLPSSVTQGCTSPTYTASNTILDLIIGGCSFFGVTAVTATQPDKVDSSQPIAGAGAPYTLSASSGVTVDTCKDKSGAKVNLDKCLAAATYSSYFKFATDRVLIRR